MLGFVCLAVILGVTYSMLREGLLTAACTLFNVLIAGLVAFSFFEPVAVGLEELLRGTWFDGTEDAFALVGLFALVFAVLKIVTGQWSGTVPDYPLVVDRAGSGLLGAITGYLVAGFLFCVFQTLPWSPTFLGFEYKVEPGAPGAGMRRYLPPDRVWLAMMQRAGDPRYGPFSQAGQPGFDEDGSFAVRYARYRRKAQ